MKVKWNRGAAKEIRNSRKAQQLVEKEAQNIALRADADVLPNEQRRNRSGATVAARQRGHKGRMALLSAVGRR